jgi:hypothetical protein
VEQARRKNVMLRQRFERRMRQCGAFAFSDIYQGGETEPFPTDRAVPAAFPSLDNEFPKNYPYEVARIIKNANSAMTVLFLASQVRKPGVPVVPHLSQYMLLTPLSRSTDIQLQEAA